MSFENDTSKKLSDDTINSSLRAGATAKGPRSLTLTFAETHPWEMLVRDRLAALPRGYLKRFVLSLIENCGFDLEDEEVFLQQVERLLLTKSLAGTLAASKEELLDRAQTRQSGGQVGVLNRARQIEVIETQNASGQVQSKAKAEPSETIAVPKRNEPQFEVGFGALEL